MCNVMQKVHSKPLDTHTCILGTSKFYSLFLFLVIKMHIISIGYRNLWTTHNNMHKLFLSFCNISWFSWVLVCLPNLIAYFLALPVYHTRINNSMSQYWSCYLSASVTCKICMFLHWKIVKFHGTKICSYWGNSVIKPSCFWWS